MSGLWCLSRCAAAAAACWPAPYVNRPHGCEPARARPRPAIIRQSTGIKGATVCCCWPNEHRARGRTLAGALKRPSKIKAPAFGGAVEEAAASRGFMLCCPLLPMPGTRLLPAAYHGGSQAGRVTKNEPHERRIVLSLERLSGMACVAKLGTLWRCLGCTDGATSRLAVSSAVRVAFRGVEEGRREGKRRKERKREEGRSRV